MTSKGGYHTSPGSKFSGYNFAVPPVKNSQKTIHTKITQRQKADFSGLTFAPAPILQPLTTKKTVSSPPKRSGVHRSVCFFHSCFLVLKGWRGSSSSKRRRLPVLKVPSPETKPDGRLMVTSKTEGLLVGWEKKTRLNMKPFKYC